jgi:DNA-binding CsgD family transcriptional regulator
MKPLTAKERDVAALVGNGHSIKRVAKILTERGQPTAAATVQAHVNRIAAKIDNPLKPKPMAAIIHWSHTQHAA